MQVNAQKSVRYQVQFSTAHPECAGESPAEIVVSAHDTSTVFEIMEQAYDEGGEDYRFSATYYGVPTGGYMIDSISGVPNKQSCSWFLYVQAPDQASSAKTSIGVSTYIPGDNFLVILSYEPWIPSSSTINSAETIQFTDHSCFTSTPPTPPPTKSVSYIPEGSTALDVMQKAEDDCKFNCSCYDTDKYDYSFRAVYQGKEKGFAVDTISKVSNSDSCKWILFIKNPNGEEIPVSVNPSIMVMPGTGYSLIWRYMQRVDSNPSRRSTEEL